MTNRTSIIRRYIESKAEIPMEDIRHLRQSDACADLLFDILDACLKKATPKLRRTSIRMLNQVEIESLFLRLLTFDFNKKDALTFLHQLYHNPQFYEQLEPSLSTATTLYSPQMELSSNIILQDDEQIFQYIDAQSKKQEPRRREGFSWWQEITTILSIWLSDKRFSALAAVSALLVIVFLNTNLFFAIDKTIYKSYFGSEPPYSSLITTHLPEAADVHRGGSADPKSAQLYNPENFQHLLAMLTTNLDIAQEYYHLKEFQAAHAQLAKMSRSIEEIDNNPKSWGLACQYYYIFGLTELALALEKGDKSYFNQAVDHLEKADALLKEETNASRDDVLFFLGFAYSQIDNQSMAITALDQISRNSPFEKHKNALLKKLK